MRLKRVALGQASRFNGLISLPYYPGVFIRDSNYPDFFWCLIMRYRRIIVGARAAREIGKITDVS